MPVLKMAFLQVTVRTPVGAYAGRINKVPCSEEDATRARDQLQNKISELTTLSLFTADDAEEITLPCDVIRRSVFEWKIVPAL